MQWCTFTFVHIISVPHLQFPAQLLDVLVGEHPIGTRVGALHEDVHPCVGKGRGDRCLGEARRKRGPRDL